MNEEYLKQIEDLMAKGLSERDAFVQVTSSESFMGSVDELISSLDSKKKDSTAAIEKADSGSESQDTPPAQPTMSDSDPEESVFSLQENQLELVEKASSQIGNDYAFWLKNALGKQQELNFYDLDSGDAKLKEGAMSGPGSIYLLSSPFMAYTAAPYYFSEAKDYIQDLFQTEDQKVRKDLPVPPENSPAYKQWYNSLPPSVQSDVAAPKDYLDYEFTPEQEQLAEDAFAEVQNKFYQLEGLAEAATTYKAQIREDLNDKLDAGEIDKAQFLEENDKITNDYLQDVFQTFMEKEGGNIVNRYIGDIDKDTDFAEAFTDKLFYEYGLDTDIDGDGMYNSQTILGDFGFLGKGFKSGSFSESADAETYRLYTGIESLAENIIDYAAEAFGSDYASDEYFEKQREYLNKRYEAENADVTLVTKGMTEAFGDGDVTAGFTHLGNAVGTMVPLVVMTAAEEAATGFTGTGLVAAQWAATLGRLGLTANRLGRAGKAVKAAGRIGYDKLLRGAGSEITYGLASGSATYTSIADDDSWGNGALGTADKVLYSGTTGLGDYMLTRFGKNILRTNALAKSAEGTYRAGKILAKESADIINKRMIKGFAAKRGLNLGGEALSEAVTNTAQYIIEADSKGQNISFEEAAYQALDGAIMGAAVGGVFDVSGSLLGRGRNALRGGLKYDIDFQSDLNVLKEDLKTNTEALKNTNNIKQRAAIQDQISQIESAIQETEIKAQPFYDMLTVRHPEAIESLNRKDAEIAIAAAKLRASEDGSPQERTLRGELKVLVDQRIQIESAYRTEDGNYRLTAVEKLKITDMKIEDRMQQMSDELNLQEIAAKEREAAKESLSETTREQGQNLLSKQRQRVAEVNEINNRYKEAKETLEEAESKGESKEKIQEAAESLAAVQNELIDYLGLDVRNGIVVLKGEEKVEEAVELDEEGKPIEKEEVEVEEVEAEEATPEVKITEVKAYKDGSFRTPEDVPGMSEESRRFLNVFMPLVQKMYPGAKAVITHDANSVDALEKQLVEKYGEQAKGFNENGGLWVQEGNTGTVYVNPTSVAFNAKLENLEKKKTLEETVLEETMHAIIGPSIQQMSVAKQKKILSELKSIVKNDSALLKRVEAKRETYAAQDKNAKEVREEEIVEILSAVVADPSAVNMTLISKIRAILNKIISTLGRKELTINSDSSAIKILHALNNASNLRVEQVAKAEAQAKASKRISPYALKEEGPVTVKYNKTIYKYSKGLRKDIGSEPVEKTFNGKWHFINWWKKSTDMGKKSNVFGFEVDGNAVDVESLYKTRASSRLGASSGRATEIIDRHNNRIQEAIKQGIITELEAREINKDWIGRPTNVAKYYERIPAEEMAKDADLQRIYNERLELLSKLEEKSISIIESKVKSTGKKFYYGPDEPASRASTRLNRRLQTDLLGAYSEHVKEWENHICNIGDNVACNTSKITPKRLFFTAHVIEHFGINPEILDLAHPRNRGKLTSDQEFQLTQQQTQVARALAAEFGAIVSRENIEDMGDFGLKGQDPREFFNNHNKGFNDYVDSLVQDFDYNDSQRDQIENLKPLYDYILAITSNGSQALSNNGVTMDLFNRITSDFLSGNIDPTKTGFMSSDVIRFIGSQREFNELRPVDVHYTGTRGDRMSTISSQLEKLNNIVKEFAFVSNSKTGKVILNGKEFVEAMSATTEGKYNNRSQQEFGSKIGNYALSLSGNMTVLTQDSHVLHMMDTMKGHYLPISDIVQGTTKAALEAKLEELGVKVKNKNLEPRQLMDIVREIKEDDSSPYQKEAENFYKTIKGYRPINDTVWNRKQNEEIIDEALALINKGKPANEKITKAVFGQSLYASSRSVYHKDYTPNDRMVTELLDKTEKDNRKYSKLSLEQRVDEVKDNLQMAFSSRLTRASERQLELFDTMPLQTTLNLSDATDSPLFRERDRKEVLNYKGKTLLTEEAEIQALNTHATSRKIMEQNNEVNVGDRVGVRLNLNVLSNTGVPVQALHEITSTGNVKNVLKYGTAITIKNPTLFVNQDAREKIATFQDNKFPMASVNGEFVSSKINEANFDGVKAIFNPHKSNVFTDVAGRPIKSAQEATVIGNDVFLRGKIEYYDFNDPIVMRGRKESVQSKTERLKRGEDYNASVRKFEIYTGKFGATYESRAELEAAYDNLSLESKVALDQSEYAKNLLDNDVVIRASKRLRRTAGRAARMYQGSRADILNNPNNYISPQNLANLKGDLKEKSIQELTELFTNEALGRLSERNDDLSVLAGIELFNRRIKNKDFEGSAALIEELASTGTTVGRMLRHFRELKTSTPEGMAMMIKQEVAKRNKKLSEDQEKRLMEMSKDLFDLHLEHEELMRQAIAGDDVEAALEAKTKEVKKKERELDTFANTVIEKGWSEIATQLIQGNLLTPMSQITNIGANMINAMGKVAVDAIALPIEKVLNLFPAFDSPIKRNYSLNAYVYGMRKFGSGFVESLDEIATGQTKDVTEWRVQRGFAPIRSLLSSIGSKRGEALPVNVGGKFRKGKTSHNQRAKLFIQGSFGIPAEVMFRFLSLGDTPFRRATEGIELYQMGKSKGLKGEALMRFMKYPDRKSREIAEREGRKLTFQERTAASEVAEQSINFMQRMLGKGFDVIPGVDGEAVARFLVRASVPFVRTPANILMDTLTFVSPVVAGVRIMGDLKNKDTRSAAQNFGKIMVGSMVTQAALILIKEGLISGEIEWDEDEDRNLAYDQFPPNSINISGLKRWFDGDSTEKRDDDNFISYNKLGIPGTIIGAMVKGVDKDELKSRDYDGVGFIHHALTDAFGTGPFSSISHMMDQSFLQGVNNFMEVLTATDPDDFSTASERWLSTTFKAASATVLPNTISALHRSSRTYMPDMRITKDMDYGERMLKRAEYIIKDRTFGTADIPVKVSWKGDPIEQNPRGNAGWFYQLFDITKLRKGEDDDVSQEMYRIYEQTEAIPEVVGTPGYAAKRKVAVPNLTQRKAKKAIKRAGLEDFTFLKDEKFLASSVYLNTDHINQMMKVSGKDRYAAIEKLMSDRKYQNSSDYEKLEMLNKLNDDYKSAIEYDRRGDLRPHSIQLLHIMENIYRNDYEKD